MPTVVFIPNDPLAVNGPAERNVTPGTFPAGAKLTVAPVAKPGTYKPHTPEFDYWQALTALIAGMRTWAAVDGKALAKWQGNRVSLPVKTNAGDDLNAFYDRNGLEFFSHTFNGSTVHSAESVDVVTHEQGHAILDALRPDFWSAPFIEIGALHEAFGDCVALLTALSDKTITDKVVAATPDLTAKQFVESLAEELGEAIRREYGPSSVEAGALRHALNTFRWSDPTALPPSAPADKLAGEVHSFARVFVGAFYDTIRNIYTAGPKTSANLQAAALRAGKLLAAAIRTVPAAPRVFEGVGKRMLQAEVTLNKGTFAAQVRAAFASHGISLAAPSTSLAVPLENKTRGDGTKELKKRMGVPPSAKIEVTEVDSKMHEDIAHVTTYRTVTAPDVLPGVNIAVPMTARVTRRGKSITGVVGDPDTSANLDSEARAFVRTLVNNGDVKVSGRLSRRVAPIAPHVTPRRSATHEVRTVGGKPTLVRVGFACASHRDDEPRKAE